MPKNANFFLTYKTGSLDIGSEFANKTFSLQL